MDDPHDQAGWEALASRQLESKRAELRKLRAQQAKTTALLIGLVAVAAIAVIAVEFM